MCPPFVHRLDRVFVQVDTLLSTMSTFFTQTNLPRRGHGVGVGVLDQDPHAEQKESEMYESSSRKRWTSWTSTLLPAKTVSTNRRKIVDERWTSWTEKVDTPGRRGSRRRVSGPGRGSRGVRAGVGVGEAVAWSRCLRCRRRAGPVSPSPPRRCARRRDASGSGTNSGETGRRTRASEATRGHHGTPGRQPTGHRRRRAGRGRGGRSPCMLDRAAAAYCRPGRPSVVSHGISSQNSL